MRVESRGDEHNLRPESFELRDHSLIERLQVMTVAASGLNRDIERVTQPLAEPDVRLGAGARIIRVLMEADIINRVVVLERVLCPVSMMDVPVHYRHPPDAILRLDVTSGDRHVIEKTEAPGLLTFGVMTRRAYRAKTVGDPSTHHRVAHVETPPHRGQGDMVCPGTHRVVHRIEKLLSGLDPLLHTLDICFLVDQFQVTLVGRAGRHREDFIHISARLESPKHRPQPLRPLRVSLSGLVFEKNIVIQKGRLHHGNPRESTLP